jgi:hypothetical protein
MRIGLVDVDGHAKKKKWGATVYPNLALCKISAWHKAQGDEVVWYEPMFTGHCDKVYISKVFNFTPDVDFFIDADEIIKGGTGYDAISSLPYEIDMTQPDYNFILCSLKILHTDSSQEDVPTNASGVSFQKRKEQSDLTWTLTKYHWEGQGVKSFLWTTTSWQQETMPKSNSRRSLTEDIESISTKRWMPGWLLMSSPSCLLKSSG